MAIEQQATESAEFNGKRVLVTGGTKGIGEVQLAAYVVFVREVTPAQSHHSIRPPAQSPLPQGAGISRRHARPRLSGVVAALAGRRPRRVLESALPPRLDRLPAVEQREFGILGQFSQHRVLLLRRVAPRATGKRKKW